ncbi:TOBE domain-containing protein [Pseudoroseomonas wenyumeiae]
MVKQERLSLSRAEPAAMPNRFPCRVAERIYLGGSIAYRCEAAGLSLTALLPNHPLFEQFVPGDEGWIGWSAADCAFFPSDRNLPAMNTTRRQGQMKLGAFFHPTGHHVAAWLHPDAQIDAGTNFRHYARMTQVAERAKFDLVFLADLPRRAAAT